MARSGSGSNYMTSPSAYAAATFANFSFHFIVRASGAPGAGITKALDVWGTSNHPAFGFSWGHSNASFRQAMFMREAGGTFRAAKATTSLLANTDYAIGGSYDGTNMKVWVDGVNEATAAASAMNAANTAQVRLLTGGVNVGTEYFSNGQISEVGLWSVALSADDFQGLAARHRPTHFRRDALVAYLPLLANASDLIAAPYTDTGTPVYTDHPRILGKF